MIKESYTDRFYTYYSKYISNVLALRPPQEQSLDYFAKLCDIVSLQKNPTTTEQIIADNQVEYEAQPTLEQKEAAQEYFKTLGSFERDFPSVCFALATGIGKTRLMGACIAYLRYEKGIKNFFVMAPNLTIYRKLKSDLGNPSNPKYVFKGLDLFVNPPRIIDGDNYKDFRQGTFGVNDVVINIFNIDKLNKKTERSSWGIIFFLPAVTF